jgi:hypothetical protein
VPDYHPAFLAGEQVQVVPDAALKRFKQEWTYHHPLAPEQLALAGRKFQVGGVSFYHGGGCLYELRGAPGLWHESCLEDPGDRGATQDRASTIYSVAAETRAGQPIVVVRDQRGVEFFVARQTGNEIHAKHMRKVSEILTVSRFERRYGFAGDRNRPDRT